MEEVWGSNDSATVEVVCQGCESVMGENLAEDACLASYTDVLCRVRWCALPRTRKYSVHGQGCVEAD